MRTIAHNGEKMRLYDIIKKKRDGGKLSKEEIDFVISGYTAGDIPDYQISALLMAIYFRGMDIGETTELTLAISRSGQRFDFKDITGIRADKHSTGGVGDKTSLIVAPVVASLGVKVAKISGRGLGHTGGTVDKLEAIKGYNTELPMKDFVRIANEVGMSIIGQSGDVAPADKKLYALRDVTATVDSIPLIASSIMGKKLAADDDCIVLDVKTGSGAFMRDEASAKELANVMVGIGKRAGKKITALITDMDKPLGKAIGNTLEVVEAIDALRGNAPDDLMALSVALSTEILFLAGKGDRNECEKLVYKSINEGFALRKFAESVKAHGGDERWIYNTSLFPKARYSAEFKATKAGYIERVDTDGYGIASLLLGAGRNTKDDIIMPTAGIILDKKTGDKVECGERIATLYAEDEFLFESALKKLNESTHIGNDKPGQRSVVIDRIE